MRDLDDVERENQLRVQGYMDAAAVPVPDAGDDTLREQVKRTLYAAHETHGGCAHRARLRGDHYVGPCIECQADALLPLIRDHVAAAMQGERERRLWYQRLHVIHMQDQLRMIHALGNALGVDQNDADSCVPGCDEGAQGLEHDLHHLIERDAARRATIERVRALTVDAVESSGYDDLVRVSDIRAVLEGRCCDLHNKNCEPPSELCCPGCTEHSHPKHPPGVTCVMEATP